MIGEIILPIFVFVSGIIVVTFYATHSFALQNSEQVELNNFEQILLLTVLPIKHNKVSIVSNTFPVYPGIIRIKCTNFDGNKCSKLDVTIKVGNTYAEKEITLPDKLKIYNSEDNILDNNRIFVCNAILNLYLNGDNLILKCWKEQLR